MSIDLLHPDEPPSEDEAPWPTSSADTAEEGVTAPMGAFVGRRLGPYCLLDLIGQGGMGEIWRAEDIRLGRKVAVKLLPSRLAGNAVSNARFLQEARAASALEHPNICSIYEVGETADQQLYLVMPCYKGESLQDRIAHGPLPVSEVLDLAGQIAKGLSEAHRNGIVHRDIKPSNLMITEDGILKILDFGIAKLAGQDGLTRAGVVVGTLSYMSPEQLRGKPADERTDLWALGVVIYEMLTGRHPFPGEQGVAIREAILHADPEPLKKIRPDVPTELERLVVSLLSKDPAGRIPSATSVTAVLCKIAEDPSPSRPGWLIWMAAARWRIAVGLIVLGLMVAGGIAVWRERKNIFARADSSSAESSAMAAAASDSRQSVAVLGFRDLSENASDQWLGPALTEMLTAELAAGGNIRVVSSERTARARQALSLLEKESPERAYMESLHALVGAKLAVRGSYLPIGNPGQRRLRVDIQILNLPAGDVVGSMVEQGEEAELFALVARAGAKLRSTLGFSPPTQEQRLQVRKLLPDGSDALRLYTEALSRLRTYDLVGARDLLLRAEAIEPSSVAVQSALSEVWALLGQDSRAREAALRAFQGRHSLPQENQLAIEAHFYETGKQWERASSTYRSLLTLFPDNLDYGLKLADTLSMAGHGPEGLAVLGGLHERPAPQGNDPRIDLTEAIVSWRLSDVPRAAKAAEATVAKGRDLGSWLMIARGLIYRGNLAGVRGRPQEGIAFLRQAQDLALRAGDRWTSARVDANLADILLQQGDLDGSEQVELHALASAREIGTAVGIGAQLSSLGKIRRARGDFQGARRLLEEALAWHRRIDYRMWEAWTEADLGPILLALGDPVAAQRSLAESLTLSRSVSNSSGEVKALQGLAELKMREGDLEEAARLQESALPILRRLRDPRLGAEALDFSADLLGHTGDLASARHRRVLAEAASRHAADRLVSCRLLGTGARCSFREGDLSMSRSASEEQLRLARQMRARPLEVTALRGLARIAWVGGEMPKTLDLLREARGIAEKSGDRLTVTDISVELARADLEGGDFDASLKLAREAADWYHDRHFSDESLALAIAAEDLLRLRRPGEARELAARAWVLTPEADHELRLEIAPALARVEAAQGDPAKALRDLGSDIMEAEQNGWVPAAFEARLAQGEILARRGGGTVGSEELGRLQKDAEAKGFHWIAHRAAGLLVSTGQSTAKAP